MLQSTTPLDVRKKIRSKIVPFGGIPPDKITFCVGWTTEALTFEQIVDTLRPQIVKDLLYFKKVARQYIADLLQQGWLRLWKALHENASLLVELSRRKAADFVTNRTGSATLHDYFRRYASYHALSRWNDPDTEVYEDNITEIVIGSSLKSSGRGKHALFTRVTDRMLDIEAAIRKAATWCGDNLKALAALYYVTTSVSQLDAGRMAGLPIKERKNRNPYCPTLQYWAKKVLQYLRKTLASYKPIEPNKNAWRKQLKAGDTVPVEKLAKKYADDEFKLLALYTLTTRVSQDCIVSELGVNDSKLRYAEEQLRHELRCMYARRILGRA